MERRSEKNEERKGTRKREKVKKWLAEKRENEEKEDVNRN